MFHQCPNCGAEVPEKAKACPGCGSDEKTGWSENAYIGGLNLPDESFNYEEYAEREFGAGKIRPRGVSWFWWVVGIALTALLVWGFVRFL